MSQNINRNRIYTLLDTMDIGRPREISVCPPLDKLLFPMDFSKCTFIIRSYILYRFYFSIIVVYKMKVY